MSQNILITGAAGYIGGSLLADLLSRQDGPIKSAKIFAVVRSNEQAQRLSNLGVEVIEADLLNESSVKEAIISREINVVVHTAGAIDPRMASNLIKGLGERRRVSENETSYIHTSVMTMFAEEGGWPFREVKDNDPEIHEKQKRIQEPNPVRHLNILITEQGKALNVNTYNVPVPMTYGRGTGEWKRLSVNIPALVRTSIKLGKVYKFEKDSSPPTIHISDLTAVYVALIGNILQNTSIPSGENGYYFATAHRSPWWKVMQLIAEGLHSRGLVKEPKVDVWPTYDEAADALGFPRLYVRAMCTSNGDIVPINAPKLGWKPTWDEKRFFESIGDEIQAVQDLDTVKMSLFDSLE